MCDGHDGIAAHTRKYTQWSAAELQKELLEVRSQPSSQGDFVHNIICLYS